MQNNSVRNYLTTHPYLFSAENETSSAEVHLPRDRYGSNVNGLPILTNNEGMYSINRCSLFAPSVLAAQGNNGIRSYVPDETIWDPKFSQMNQTNEEMAQPHEQDMEVGYEESPPPPTYEGLEQRFVDEIMKLTREKSDAEDAEFARHEERILKINAEYQEKLSSLRALQATRREEFLHKELQARLKQHHEAKRNHCPNTKVPDAYGYESPTYTSGEATGSRFDGAIEYKNDGKQTLHSSSGRSKVKVKVKVPLPPGRVYNNSAVYH